MLTAEQRQLVEDNWRLSRFVIKKYFRRGEGLPIEYEDLEQIGYIGLCRAALRYDPKKETTFATFACMVIRAYILQQLRNMTAVKRQSNFLTVSLQQEYANAKGNNITLAEMIPDARSDIEDRVLLQESIHQVYEKVIQEPGSDILLACLTKQITQQEAAQQLGISQATVSRRLAVYEQRFRAIAIDF